MNATRKPLLALSMLLILALACSLAEFVGGQEQGGTLPGTAPPTEAPGEAVASGEAPAETATPRRLELPPTPTAFHVLSEDDPRSVLDLPNPDHVDYFDQPTWYEYDAEGATYRIENGHLLGIDHTPEERFIYWSYTSFESGNTYAEISATNGDCIGKDSVGLVIRVDPEMTPSGYSLEVSCDGEFRFRRPHGGETPSTLVDWTASDAIDTGPGAVNRLSIWGYQDHFVLFINGVQVGEATDPGYTYDMGYFALFVRASQTFDLTATFDDFAYWHIPYQE
jgi:hypothetical protein